MVMPVLVPLLFGVMEFSWYFQKQQLVESGVRDAARYLARTAPDTTPPTDPCSLTMPIDFVANSEEYCGDRRHHWRDSPRSRLDCRERHDHLPIVR